MQNHIQHNRIHSGIRQEQSTMIRNQARVADLLEWTQQEYGDFKYNTGLEYLREYFSGDQKAIDRLSVHKDFWNWWKNEWNQRDDSFIDTMDGQQDKFRAAWLRAIYQDYHNHLVLAAELSIPPAAYPPDFTIIKTEMAIA